MIEPLTSPAELVEESIRQKNCAADFVGQIPVGDDYIYRVLAPERAPLSILREGEGIWRIGQLLSTANADVRPPTRHRGQAWLEPFRSPSE